jgi:acid phosphatase type 7
MVTCMAYLVSQQQLFDDFMDTAVDMFASEIPMYYARGNHEARGVFAHNFFDYFPSPTGDLYYMFRQGPVSFLVFDSGEDKPDSDIEYYGIAAFDQYMDQQAAWFRKAVNDEVRLTVPYLKLQSYISRLIFHGTEQKEFMKSLFRC